jgi:CheY-like chemotaxis protein
MKVLVIEDHEQELRLVMHVLVDAGNNVGGVASAEQAIEAIRRDRPDLLLVDITLPGIDGFQLARSLRADPETRELAMVAVTTYPEEYPRHDALLAGFDGYLVKPISTRTLPDELKQIVAQRNGDSIQ